MKSLDRYAKERREIERVREYYEEDMISTLNIDLKKSFNQIVEENLQTHDADKLVSYLRKKFGEKDIAIFLVKYFFFPILLRCQ